MRILTFVWFSLNILAIVVFLFSPGEGRIGEKEGLSAQFAEERQPEEMGRLRMNSVPVHSDRRNPNPPVGSKETSERQPNSSLHTPRRILFVGGSTVRRMLPAMICVLDRSSCHAEEPFLKHSGKYNQSAVQQYALHNWSYATPLRCGNVSGCSACRCSCQPNKPSARPDRLDWLDFSVVSPTITLDFRGNQRASV